MSKQFPSIRIRFSRIVVLSHVQCPSEAINELAQAIIATDGALARPIVVERTELQTFSLRHGHFEYYGWQKAIQILNAEGKNHELEAIPALILESDAIIEQDKQALLKQVALHEAEAVRQAGEQDNTRLTLALILEDIKAQIKGGTADAMQLEHLLEAYSNTHIFKKSIWP